MAIAGLFIALKAIKNIVNRKNPLARIVIPAKAGIHRIAIDSRLRGNDRGFY
jgi:hypothetical protein